MSPQCTYVLLIPPILTDPVDSYQTGELVAVGNNQICPFWWWDMSSNVSSAESSLLEKLGDQTDTTGEPEKS